MLGIFKKAVEVKAPVNGKLIPIENIPDEVFSQKMAGDGLGIEVSDGIVTAPVEGEVMLVFTTKHALAIRTPEGFEVMLHIGIDTVKMGGEGFDVYVKKGDKVKAGQEIMKFDLELVKEKAASTITPVIITNMSEVASIEKKSGTVTRGKDIIMKITKK